MSSKIGIIGAGIGGISSAIQLAISGYEVDIFEKNQQAGGKLNELKKDGYRFDTGPSVFTMPELIDELFQMAGKNPRDYFSYHSLNESCTYFYEDGSVIQAQQNINDFALELEAKTGEPTEHLFNFLEKSKTIYDLTAEVFVFSSIHDTSNFFRKSSLQALLNFKKIDAFRTMHQANSQTFNSEKVVRLFDRYATYNGSDPYKAPATLNIIPHLEHNKGTFFPDSGMFSVVDAIVNLAKDLGVRFHFNEEVKELEFRGKQVVALHTDKKRTEVDAVVSGMDVHSFYNRVFKNEKLFKKHVKYEKSSSAMIFYWGVNGTFSQLNLHNILFAENYKEEFEALFDQKEIFPDPTVYIYISSKQVVEDAPPGKENWYVMINGPENVGQDWEEFKIKARAAIVKKIDRILHTTIENYIEFEEYMDPGYIEEYTSSYHGSLYGNSSNGKFAAFNRHPNFSKRFNNLFFVGGSVHPGGGIPLCLASAKIVSERIKDVL